MQLRGAYNWTVCDWLDCTIELFVNQAAKTYLLYVFSATFEGIGSAYQVSLAAYRAPIVLLSNTLNFG